MQSHSEKDVSDVEAQQTDIELVRRHSTTTGHRSGQDAFRHGKVDPAIRLPIAFRTMSIHVETKASFDDPAKAEKEVDKRKLAVKELASLDWHKISTDEVLTRLRVSQQTGLESAQIARLLQQSGKNEMTPPKSNFARKLLEWLLGGFGSLLLVASIICFIAWKPLGDPPNASNLALAIVLLLVLVLQAIFNAWQDFSTSRVMASIKGMLPSDVSVFRDSAAKRIPAKDLVPGDIVNLAMGEKVPADLRLIDVSHDLQFDRAILTGESEPVAGRVDRTDDNFMETRNIALQGTHCVNGTATGIVIQTGDRTVFGIIAKLSSMESTRLTTLQRELLRFVAIIAALATSVATIMVILWGAWLRKSFPDYINVPTLLIDVVSVMVAFIPEGLPVAVTLSLAKVANTLSKKKILCKSLSIVETLGSVNVLCSDKTGTLTKNIMHVSDIALLDTVYEPESFKSNITTAPADVRNVLAQLVAVGAVCNSAKFDSSAASTATTSQAPPKILGNATDVAILRFANSVSSAEVARKQWVQVYRKNFNSKTKYMLELSSLAADVSLDAGLVAPLASWDNFKRSDFLLTVKGAPEMIMPRCTHVLNPLAASSPMPMTDAVRDRVINVQERWGRQGKRVLLLARRIVRDEWLEKTAERQPENFGDVVEEYNEDLILVGLVGLMDPLKDDIKDTVSICRSAGIRFFIVTGDHPTTALSIAAQAGIITNPNRVHRVSDLPRGSKSVTPSDSDSDVESLQGIIITGPELMSLQPNQLHQLCQYEEIVFARTTPEQKLHIVNSFKALGNVVAVTGDGVNDAPSLKAADCGVAMGDGSDVAKEAADLILLGEFSSIITAIEYGRLVFDNLKKTVLYLLPAGSFSELMPIVFNIVFGVPQMLSNIQMIVICVGTDVLPALSLCMEKPESGLLLRKPRNIKTDRLADWRLLLHAYGFLGVLESLCAMAMSFWYLQTQGHPFSKIFLSFDASIVPNDALFTAQTIYFFTLVMMQWGNLFASRSRRLSVFQHSPLNNLWLFPAAIMALAIGLFFCYVPFFQNTFQFSPIPTKFYFIPITFGIALLTLDELRKLLVRKNPKGILAKLAW